MTKSPSLRIMNVHVASRYGDRVSLCCEADGAEYHVWLNVKTGKTEDALYKNPPTGTARVSEKYFNTKRLSTTSTRGAAMIAIMMELYRNNRLLAKYEAEVADQVAKEDLERQARDREEVIKAHAPELLAALKEIDGLLSLTEQEKPGDRLNWSSNVRLAWHAAARAIAKVEGK